MERVVAYSDIREMTPEVLLELTQSHKYESMKDALKNKNGISSRELFVTEKEIEAMGETLKMVVFFVSPHIMRTTMELARDKGVLIQSSRWL